MALRSEIFCFKNDFCLHAHKGGKQKNVKSFVDTLSSTRQGFLRAWAMISAIVLGASL